MKRYLYSIVYLVLLASLCNCSANYYLKRSQKLERKAIILGADVKHDTIYIDRPVIVPERIIDTVVQHVNFHDTITVVQNKVRTRVKIDTVHHTLYVNTVCPSDTVIIKQPVTITKEIKTSGGIPWWIWAIMGAMGFIMIVIAIKK